MTKERGYEVPESNAKEIKYYKEKANLILYSMLLAI